MARFNILSFEQSSQDEITKKYNIDGVSSIYTLVIELVQPKTFILVELLAKPGIDNPLSFLPWRHERPVHLLGPQEWIASNHNPFLDVPEASSTYEFKFLAPAEASGKVPFDINIYDRPNFFPTTWDWENKMTLNVPPANGGSDVDLVAGDLKWDAKNGGLIFTYSVAGSELKRVKVKDSLRPYLEISKDDEIISDSPVGNALSVIKGKHTFPIKGSTLSQYYSEGGSYSAMIKFTGAADRISENNSARVADVQITQAQPVGRATQHSLNVIAYGLRMAGSTQATITSIERDAEHQVRVMYDNIRKKGAKSQFDLYAPAGDSLIQAYVDTITGLNVAKSGVIDKPHSGLSLTLAQEEEVKAAMLAASNRVGPWNVSKHYPDPNRVPKLQTLDIGPSSFTPGTAKRFMDELLGQGWLKFKTQKSSTIYNRIIPPGNDPAYHLEINQPSPALMKSMMVSASVNGFDSLLM